jgi:hypothetical protein
MPQTRNRKAQNQRRITAPLPEALNRHLQDYAEAAKGASRAEATWLLSGVTVSAVGLGILALPQLVHAEVVYTPANQSVNENARKLQIDFNHDGIADASLSVQGYCNSGSGFRECFGSIFALGLQGNEAMTSGGFAAAAKIGKIIGHQDQFQDFPEMAKSTDRLRVRDGCQPAHRCGYQVLASGGADGAGGQWRRSGSKGEQLRLSGNPGRWRSGAWDLAQRGWRSLKMRERLFLSSFSYFRESCAREAAVDSIGGLRLEVAPFQSGDYMSFSAGF